MAIDPMTAAAVLGSLFGGGGSTTAAKDAAYYAGKAQANAQDLSNLGWQYQEPFAQSAGTINAGLDPTRQAMLGLVAYLNGVAPGTQIALPQQDNTAIPTYLRSYATAAPGTWQNELFRRAMYNNASESQIGDLLKDIGRGENGMARINRSWLQAAPTDWQAPALKTGGGSLTVPGAQTASGGTGLPGYLDLPDVDTLMAQLQAADDASVEQMLQTMRAQPTQNLVQRGFIGPNVSSTTQTAAQNNVPLWAQQLQAQSRGKLAQTGYDMKMNKASYLQNTASNLLNMLTGQQAQMMPYANTGPQVAQANQTAANYNQLAQGYGQQAGQDAGMWGQLLGTALGGTNIFGGNGSSSQNIAAAQKASSYNPAWGLQPPGTKQAQVSPFAEWGLQPPGTKQEQVSPFAEWMGG